MINIIKLKYYFLTNPFEATALARPDLKSALHHFEEIKLRQRSSVIPISMYSTIATNCHWKLMALKTTKYCNSCKTKKSSEGTTVKKTAKNKIVLIKL